jgi:hypothetical protein
VLLSACIGVLLSGVACEQTPPFIAPDAEVTYDGLHRVSRSRMQNAWAKPDLSLAGYDRILPTPAELQYRAVRGSGGRGRDGFPLSDSERERLERLVREEFRRELDRSQHFTITDQPGPTVLVLRSGLLDIVSFAPPAPSGSDKQWIAQIGQATLVLELRDSQSGEVLARTVDRRAAEPSGGELGRNTSVHTAAAVRTVARRWARTLRERLDELHETSLPVGG